MNSYRQLSDDEINDFVEKNRDWRNEGNKLRADFELADFKSAIAVVNAVANLAEDINHHPAWSNEYNKLSFTLSTHEAGGKITEADVILAEKISFAVGNSSVKSS